MLLAAVQDRPTTMADVEWQQPAEKGRSAMEVAERLSFAIMQVGKGMSEDDFGLNRAREWIRGRPTMDCLEDDAQILTPPLVLSQNRPRALTAF